ncbi:MAG: hypothetical protein M3003_16970 [Candidatus Dormibacteraeota bacterium]|nr:hypothetical protein [Candidatus Dormibacteraeota bacterium]
MIALCVAHAATADGGAFTNEQLRTLKREGSAKAEAIRGRFDWMRRDLLAVVGGNFYHRCPVILQLGNRPVVWFRRDENGYLLLNFWMPTASGEERARVLDNWWVVPPAVADLECPPTGRRIHVRYPNGDDFRVEFFDIASADDFASRYPASANIAADSSIHFPVVGVEVSERAPGTPIEFGPIETRVGGIHMIGNFMENISGAAIQIDMPAGVGGPSFRDQDITPTDLVTADNPVLDRMRFDNCRILGPAVLLLQACQLSGSGLGGPMDAILWNRTLPAVGAIIANACVFDNCEFIGVGFALPPAEITQLQGQPQAQPHGPAAPATPG